MNGPFTLTAVMSTVEGHPMVSPAVVREWYSKLSVTAGGDQAAKSYRLVRAILNTAVDDELISRNPCRIPEKRGTCQRSANSSSISSCSLSTSRRVMSANGTPLARLDAFVT